MKNNNNKHEENEQEILKLKGSARYDIFAFGVILHELICCGQQPKCDKISLGQNIANKIIEGNVENINSKNAEENMKEIETQLFGLKSNLQIVSNSISTLLNEVEEVANATEAREQNI